MRAAKSRCGHLDNSIAELPIDIGKACTAYSRESHARLPFGKATAIEFMEDVESCLANCVQPIEGDHMGLH